MPQQSSTSWLLARAGRIAFGVALLIPGARSFTANTPKIVGSAGRTTMSTLEEHRGSNKWAGLIPAKSAPREWDEGFRSFLVKYGMLNHVVYDVFIKGEEDAKDERGLRGTSRFKDDLKAFTKNGLEFSYVNKLGERKKEYDFSDEYTIIGNMVCSPRSFFTAEDNWFGFLALSNDNKELVIVFRGTETTKEWVENATMTLEQLDDEPPESGFALFFNNKNLMVHSGFQQLYKQKSVQGIDSPKETVHRLIAEHKGTLEKVTVIGHSLGGAMAQLCAVDIAHSKVLDKVPVLGIAWAAPRIGNQCLTDWVDEMHPTLSILRVRIDDDSVTNVPPQWLWSVFNGGYQHMGTEILLSNKNLHAEGVVKSDDGNSPNHNLEQYLHNLDPTRDVALMNKVGTVIPEKYCIEHSISPAWHSQTWPRTVYNK